MLNNANYVDCSVNIKIMREFEDFYVLESVLSKKRLEILGCIRLPNSKSIIEKLSIET